MVKIKWHIFQIAKYRYDTSKTVGPISMLLFIHSILLFLIITIKIAEVEYRKISVNHGPTIQVFAQAEKYLDSENSSFEHLGK